MISYTNDMKASSGVCLEKIAAVAKARWYIDDNHSVPCGNSASECVSVCENLSAVVLSSFLFQFHTDFQAVLALGPGQHIYCRRKSSMSATIFTHFDPQSVMLIKSIKSCHECVWISIIINILQNFVFDLQEAC